MNVTSLITLRISTNYTTIYRGHSAKNATIAHTLRISTNYTTIYRGHGAKNATITYFRPGITNELDKRNRRMKSNKRTNEGGRVQPKFIIRLYRRRHNVHDKAAVYPYSEVRTHPVRRSRCSSLRYSRCRRPPRRSSVEPSNLSCSKELLVGSPLRATDTTAHPQATRAWNSMTGMRRR